MKIYINDKFFFINELLHAHIRTHIYTHTHTLGIIFMHVFEK